MTSFADIAGQLDALAIEVPSWAYGNSGTRFKVFGTPARPGPVQEKIADAAQVHRLTGLAHRPWPCTSRGTSSTTGLPSRRTRSRSASRSGR